MDPGEKKEGWKDLFLIKGKCSHNISLGEMRKLTSFLW